jgi:hypothetical protein
MSKKTELLDKLESFLIENKSIKTETFKEIYPFLNDIRKQLTLTDVVERLPIGTVVTIKNDKNFFNIAGTKMTITGYCDYNQAPIGYKCDNKGIFLIEDFVR